MQTIYQSDPWEVFQRKLGHEVVRSEGPGWKYLAVVMGGRTWRWLHCPYGPEAETPRAFDAALSDLELKARARHCWFVRGGPGADAMLDVGEPPHGAFRRRGLRPALGEGFWAYTQEVDLTQDEDAILKDMRSTNRNLHRNIHKKGVTFTCSTDPEDIEILIPFMDDLARKRQFNRVSDNYLREAARTLMPMGAASLYIAHLHGRPIGASLVYDWEGTRTYSHAAMDFEHRQISAGIPLVVRMMLDAKLKGMTCFDLMGVASDHADAEDEYAAGYSAFKKSFGGRSSPHCGMWELPLSRWRYASFPVLRKLRHKSLAGHRTVVRTLSRATSRHPESSMEAG